jgi:hypothetical protein
MMVSKSVWLIPAIIWLSLLLTSVTCQAESTEAHKYRSKDEAVRAHRKKIIADSLELTYEEAKSFWPIYEQYFKELNLIFKRRGDTTYDFSQEFEDLTEAQSVKLINEVLQSDEDLAMLVDSYIPKVHRVLSGKKTARFLQIERRLHILFEADIGQKIPLVE